VGLRLGVWAGAELTPTECFFCSEELQQGADGRLESTTSGLFTTDLGEPGVSPVARAELELTIPLTRRLTLAPRAGAAVSQRGTRPEITLTLQWRAE